MSGINDFKDLKIWQKGIDIAEKCYFLTKLFPKDELYGMVQQIRFLLMIKASKWTVFPAKTFIPSK